MFARRTLTTKLWYGDIIGYVLSGMPFSIVTAAKCAYAHSRLLNIILNSGCSIDRCVACDVQDGILRGNLWRLAGDNTPTSDSVTPPLQLVRQHLNTSRFTDGDCSFPILPALGRVDSSLPQALNQTKMIAFSLQPKKSHELIFFLYFCTDHQDKLKSHL